ncbi:HAMP domain-containing protein [Patescibacteria group bacterium]
MKKWRDFSVSFKIVFLSTALAFIFLGGSVYFTVSGVKIFFSDFLEKSFSQDVNLNSNSLGVFLDHIRGDVLVLSQAPPVQGIIRAKDSGNNFDIEGNSSLDQWTERLEEIFSSIAQSKNVYAQIRYIDETGQEVARVNYDEEGVEVVGEGNLQNKKDRDYFTEAIVYPQGKVYSSEVNLNKEGTPPEVEVPYFPVIRYAVTVFDKNGVNKGILIINVDFEGVLSEMNIRRDVNGDLAIFDQQGDYKFHQNRDKEWGGSSSLDTGENFKKDFPQDVADEVFSNIGGIVDMEDNELFYERVYVNKGDSTSFLVLMKNVPVSTVLGPINDFIGQSFYLTGLIFFGLFLVFYFFIKRILSPLNTLLSGVESIGQGDFDSSVEVKSEDEFGVLSRAFNNMAGKLGDLYQNLEKKVEDRTSELRKINTVMMNRESRIAELKDENNKLRKEAGENNNKKEENSDFYDSNI